MSFLLQDSGGVNWLLSVIEPVPGLGLINTASQGVGSAPPAVFLNDGVGGSWQLAVTTGGERYTIPVAFNSAYPQSLQLTSPSGNNYLLEVTSGGLLETLRAVILWDDYSSAGAVLQGAKYSVVVFG